MNAYYLRNRSCPCARCRARALLGAAVLITLGVLFLLDNYGFISFPDSSPVILIVIGAFLYLSRTASTEGHIEPHRRGGPAPPQPPLATEQDEPQVKS